jgi:outer membrane immunogenic protein
MPLENLGECAGGRTPARAGVIDRQINRVGCGAIEPAPLTWGLDMNTKILAALSSGPLPPPFPATASQNYDSATFRVGGYLGYDWQFNPNWLVGVEGDFAWGNGSKHVDALQGITLPTNTGNFSEVKHTWDAGLRARLGYLITPTWLIYATGGVQWQHVEATVNCSANTCGPGIFPLGGFPYTQTNDTTRTGWAIGGGIETMLPGRWLLRGEYRYADFGTWNTAFGGSPIIVKEFDIATHTGYFGVAKKF